MNPAQVCNLSQLLRQTAALHPDRPGLIRGERQWTWVEIDARVDAMVAALRALGVGQGDRLLVQSRNSPAMFESCWVAFRLGAVWVPVNFRLTPPEVAALAASSGAVAMLVDDGFESHVQAVREAAPALRVVVPMRLVVELQPRHAGLACFEGVAHHLPLHDRHALVEQAMLAYTGFTVLPPYVAWMPGRVDAAARAAYLDGYRVRLATLDTIEPLFFHPWDDYDETQRLRPGVVARSGVQWNPPR